MKSGKLHWSESVRRLWGVWALLVLVFSPSAIAAQTPGLDPSTSGPPVRDPQAIAIIEQALTALGGKGAQLQLRTAIIHGTQQIEGEQTVASFVWEDDFSGTVPEFRKEISSGSSTHVLVSGHGTPSRQREGSQKQLAPQVSWAVPPLYLPGVVLAKQLQNETYGFELITDHSGLQHVRTSWKLNSVTASITSEDWYFDPVTKIPARVQYSLPITEAPGHVKTASIEFTDFRAVSGIAVPFQIVNHGASQKTGMFAIENVQINVSIDATHFEMTGGQQ